MTKKEQIGLMAAVIYAATLRTEVSPAIAVDAAAHIFQRTSQYVDVVEENERERSSARLTWFRWLRG